MAFATTQQQEGLPPLAKNALTIAAIFAAWKIYVKVRDREDVQNAKEEVTTAKTELQEQTKKTPLTYSPAQYKTWANSLEEAMFDLGTDKYTIVQVFKKLKKDVDVLALIDAFGTRKYYTIGISYGPKTLGQWLTIEDNWWEYLISDINKALSDNRVKYQF